VPGAEVSRHRGAGRWEAPGDLRDLIPLAEKWGIGDDIIRFDAEEKSTAADKDELLRGVGPRFEEIEAWLATAGAGEMSEEMCVIVFGHIRVVDDRASKAAFFDALMAKYGDPGWQPVLPAAPSRWPAVDNTKSPHARP
jgi:hypothetical protein